MTIKATAAESATQRASWEHEASEGRYVAAVTRTSRQDERGAYGWAWELAFSPAGGVGVHYTGARDTDLIYAPTGGPVDVLETLSAFVSAWAEAQRRQFPEPPSTP